MLNCFTTSLAEAFIMWGVKEVVLLFVVVCLCEQDGVSYLCGQDMRRISDGMRIRS